MQAASFRRTEIRVAAELAWHDECGELLGAAGAAAADGVPEAAEKA